MLKKPIISSTGTFGILCVHQELFLSSPQFFPRLAQNPPMPLLCVLWGIFSCRTDIRGDGENSIRLLLDRALRYFLVIGNRALGKLYAARETLEEDVDLYLISTLYGQYDNS
jgi:hypothetical protein